MYTFRSNGKLLVSGEYLVLAGAKAFALPLKKGQQLWVEETAENPGKLNWKSYFEDRLYLDLVATWPGLQLIQTSDMSLGEKLIRILQEVCRLNPSLMDEYKGVSFRSEADFQPDWGLGSSSTLVANIASWAQADPYLLNRNTFRSSGYDIACAIHDAPLFYQLEDEMPRVETCSFNPVFSEQLFFIYSGRKQDSRNSVNNLREKIDKASPADIAALSDLSTAIAHASDLQSFEQNLILHDSLISHILHLKPIASSGFTDFPAYVKSLGAWGGDFLLVCWHEVPEEAMTYLNKQGFNTVFRFNDLVKMPVD